MSRRSLATRHTRSGLEWTAAIEEQTSGHLQVRPGVTNGLDTTTGTLARGRTAGQVYMGFNLSRKKFSQHG
jgi:hypothetical protein